MGRPRIIWRRSPASSDERPIGDLQLWALTHHERLMPADPVRAALLRFGAPAVEGASAPKEDAIGLLMLAAEVEHALMVQYLYASQSLRGSSSRTIAHVAIEEMGHLVTIQNLLIALGGVNAEGLPALLHLGRDGLRRASERNPMPLTLERVNRTTLAKFTVVERPREIPDLELATRIDLLAAHASSEGHDVHPVYALYAALRWLFQESDKNEYGLGPDLGFEPGWHVKSDDFAPAETIDEFASNRDEWENVPGLIAGIAHTPAEALAVLDAITAQGEGLPDHADSHFERFLRLVVDFEAGNVRVRTKLPRTPFVSGQPAPEDPFATEITDEYTALWARLFNLRYELLLVDIAWGISLGRSDARRAAMLDSTIESMNKILQPLSKYLSGSPLGEGLPGDAGPPYGVLDESIPTSIDRFRERFRALGRTQAGIVAAIRASEYFPSDPRGPTRLEAIAGVDSHREPRLPGG